MYDGGVVIRENFEIINSVGLKICGRINHPSGAGGDAAKPLEPIVLLHGFKGFMEQPLFRILADALAVVDYVSHRPNLDLNRLAILEGQTFVKV